MKRTASRNFHVPLPAKTYDRLRDEAERRRRPATQLAREAVESWLAEQERLALHQEIAAYAAGHAGTIEDLDEDLADAAQEKWAREGAE